MFDNWKVLIRLLLKDARQKLTPVYHNANLKSIQYESRFRLKNKAIAKRISMTTRDDQWLANSCQFFVIQFRCIWLYKVFFRFRRNWITTGAWCDQESHFSWRYNMEIVYGLAKDTDCFWTEKYLYWKIIYTIFQKKNIYVVYSILNNN